MKIEFDKKYFSVAVYAFLVIAASVLFFAAVMNFSDIWAFICKIAGIMTPFFYGFALAYLINPVLHFFEDKVLVKLSGGKMKPKLRRGVGILLAYILVFALISIFLWVVIPQVGASVYGIVKNVPDLITNADKYVSETLGSLKRIELPSEISGKITSIIEELLIAITELLKNIVPQIIYTTKQITSAVVNTIVGIIISVYLLFSKEKFFAQIKKTLSAFLPADKVKHMTELAHSSHNIFSGFISGKILDSLIIGIICFIGMSIFNMPYAMLISVIVGVTNVISYFGPFIGAIPSIVLIMFVDPLTALGFAVFILVLQQFDGNILGPKILGDSTGISAFWVIFSVMLFGGLYGFLGMFLGVPVFAVFYAVICANVEYRLKNKGLSENTHDYSSKDHPIL